MVKTINNELISIRSTYDKIIDDIIDIKNIEKNDRITYQLVDNVINVIIKGNVIAVLSNGLMFDVLKDLLSNARYKYISTVIEKSEENNTLKIHLEIYRILDIENDPFITKIDFSLIKTTKKDNGVSRQNAYYSTRENDFLSMQEYDGSVLIRNNRKLILGELGAKAITYVQEHKANTLYVKYIGKTITDSGNIVGNIRIYEILR